MTSDLRFPGRRKSDKKRSPVGVAPPRHAGIPSGFHGRHGVMTGRRSGRRRLPVLVALVMLGMQPSVDAAEAPSTRWAVCGDWREVPVPGDKLYPGGFGAVTDVDTVSPSEAWAITDDGYESHNEATHLPLGRPTLVRGSVPDARQRERRVGVLGTRRHRGRVADGSVGRRLQADGSRSSPEPADRRSVERHADGGSCRPVCGCTEACPR